MAYTPTTWKTGDTITAEALNNIDLSLRRVSSAIQAQYLGTQTIGATTEFLLYLDSSRYSSGDGFTLTDNGLTCKYAGLVVVSASLYCNSGFTAGDQVLFTIGKNSDSLVKTSCIMPGTEKHTITTGLVLAEVAAGDVLKLKCQNVTGARGTVGSSATSYSNFLAAHYLG